MTPLWMSMVPDSAAAWRTRSIRLPPSCGRSSGRLSNVPPAPRLSFTLGIRLRLPQAALRMLLFPGADGPGDDQVTVPEVLSVRPSGGP